MAENCFFRSFHCLLINFSCLNKAEKRKRKTNLDLKRNSFFKAVKIDLGFKLLVFFSR